MASPGATGEGRDILDTISASQYLGHGAAGHVFKATYNGKDVAVKVIACNSTEKLERCTQQIIREIDCLKKVLSGYATQVERDRIVAPIAWGQTQYRLLKLVGENKVEKAPASLPQLAVVYPLVGGLELYDVVRHGRLEEPVAQYFLRRIIGAVEMLHRAGVAHRDLKPDNVMISKSIEVRLIDFGMVADAARTRGVRSTWCGTDLYNSPERHGRVAGIPKGKYDAFKGDVWSIGVMAFIMITGKLPYSATGPHVHGKVYQRNFRDPRQDCTAYKLIEKEDWKGFWAYQKERRGIDMPGADGFKQFIQGTLRWHPSKRASAYDLTRNPWLFFRGFRDEEIEPRWIAPILKDRENRTLRIKQRELELERADLARRMGMRTGPTAGPAGGSSKVAGAGRAPAPGTTSTTHGAAPGGTGSTEASTADAARMSESSRGPAMGGATMGSGEASGDRGGAGGAPMDSGEGAGDTADLTAAPARGEGGAPMRTESEGSTVAGSASASESGSGLGGSCKPMDSGQEGTAAGEHMEHFRSGSDVLRKLTDGSSSAPPPSGAFRVLPSLSPAELGLLPHVQLEGVVSADALSRFPEAISRVSRIRSARRLDNDKPIMSLVQLTVGAPDLGIEVMPAPAVAEGIDVGAQEGASADDYAAAPRGSPAAAEAHETSELTRKRSTTTTTTAGAAGAAAESSKLKPPSSPSPAPVMPTWFGEMSELEQLDVLDRAADGADSQMEVEVVEVRARAGAESASPGVALVGRLLEGSGKSSVMDVLWAVKFAIEAENVPGSAGSAGAGTSGEPGSS